MDPTAAMLLLQNDLVKGTLHAVEDADHHIYMDNPTDFTYKMILDVYGPVKAQEFLRKKGVQS